MEQYWLWLCSNESIHRQDIVKLMRKYKNPKQLFETNSNHIYAWGGIEQKKIDTLIKSRKNLSVICNQMKEKGINFISAEHTNFPLRLKVIPDAPFGLFFKGKLPDEHRMTVGIIGARRCTGYGKMMAEKIAELLAIRGIQIISGMAQGIDGFAQSAAVLSGGESYGVLGSGVDICYPKQNKKLYDMLLGNGGIISEYPPESQPLAWHFPMRNRLISGLSDCILVVEAKEKSGSLITVDMALEQGKDVYAVPGRVGDTLSTGCNHLIAQGAGIVLSENGFLKSLNLENKEKKILGKNKIILETNENLVYSCVDFHAKNLNEIISELSLSPQEVMAALTVLVMEGYVQETTKNYYIRRK